MIFPGLTKEEGHRQMSSPISSSMGLTARILSRAIASY